MDAMTALRRLSGVRRAWPDKDRSLSVEVLRSSDRGQPRLRAGRISADGRLSLLPYAQDPALPGLSPQLDGRLVVHRAGRRAVVLGDERATKLLRRGRAAAADPSTASTAFDRTGLRTPEVLERGDSHLDLAVLPGRTLHDLGGHGLPGWERLAQVWPNLTGVEAELPRHGPEEEAAVLRRWLGHVHDHRALGPDSGLRSLSARVERVCALLEQGTGPLVVAHRDLHDKQLLWDGEELGLLDLDTASRAEAALDLGNLAAHVELMEITGRLGPSSYRLVLGLLDDVATWMPTSTARLRAYTQAARLRLACVHAFRPDARSWLPAWLERCLEIPLSTTIPPWSS